MFKPQFQITPEIAGLLMQIEASKEVIKTFKITPKVLASLRQTAKLMTTHYSTAIEGNRLTLEEVENTIIKNLKSRERDEKEVMGYYSALEYVFEIANKKAVINEEVIKKIHAIVMGSGSQNHKPTVYRDGQNVIRETAKGLIVYMPPEAKDVPPLMKELTQWIELQKANIPTPILAGIAHYEFATVHPYYDGNGRTARLLTTLILHLNGYGMNGVYSLEEYYAKDLQSYYEAISIGEPNYYNGRAEADITKWILYFIKGMTKAFESVKKNLESRPKEEDSIKSKLLYELDMRQKKVLDLFLKQKTIKSSDIALVLGIGSAMATRICSKWASEGFIKSLSEGKKGRSYILAEKWKALIE